MAKSKKLLPLDKATLKVFRLMQAADSTLTVGELLCHPEKRDTYLVLMRRHVYETEYAILKELLRLRKKKGFPNHPTAK